MILGRGAQGARFSKRLGLVVLPAHWRSLGLRRSLLVLLLVCGGALRAQGMEWVRATDSAAWVGREVFPVVSFDGRIWILGGWTFPSGRNPEYNNDVWYSTDGAAWTKASDSAGWSKRAGHAAVVFDGRIWVLGGYDKQGLARDVWWSSDGTNWTRATDSAGWSWRAYHSAVVSSGRMWVFGGTDSVRTRNDVWSSADGVNWTLETDSADWCGRVAPAVVLNGRMYIMGGSNGEEDLGDVWSSSDGKEWSLETDSAGWAARIGHAAVVHDSMIWVMGGWSSPRGNLNDVWCSTNGRDWMVATDSAPWSRRSGLAALTYNGMLWMQGGITDSTSPRDVWYSIGLGADEEQPQGAGSFRLVGVRPSPFRSRANLEYRTDRRTEVSADIISSTGAVVRELTSGVDGPGLRRTSWDGKDERGSSVPPGVYMVRISRGASNQVQKLVKLP